MSNTAWKWLGLSKTPSTGKSWRRSKSKTSKGRFLWIGEVKWEVSGSRGCNTEDGEEETSQGAMLSNGGSTIFQKKGVIKIDLGGRSPWWSGRQEGRPSGWWDNNNMQPAWASLIICLTNRRRWHLSRAPGSPIHQKRILEEHYFCSARRGLVPDGGRSYWIKHGTRKGKLIVLCSFLLL